MIKKMFFFGLSIIATLALVELFIRFSHLGSVSSTEFYEDIGRAKRKDFTALYFNEGFGIIHFNEFGYIGKPRSPEKKENVIRIILLGDSFVESFQVFERDYFGLLAEEILNKKVLKTKFEILNFGRSGFDIGDIYAYQKTFAEQFNPDYILYMLSNSDLTPRYSDPLRPKTIIENDSLNISLDFNSKEITVFKNFNWFNKNSVILNMLNNCRKKTQTVPVFAILLDKLYPKNQMQPSSVDAPLRVSVDYQVNPVTKKIIESLNPDKVIIVNRDFEKLPGEFNSLCIENGLYYLDLSKSLKQMKESGMDPYEWKSSKKTGHWNPEAHKTIAFEIADFFIKTIKTKD